MTMWEDARRRSHPHISQCLTMHVVSQCHGMYNVYAFGFTACVDVTSSMPKILACALCQIVCPNISYIRRTRKAGTISKIL